MGKPSNQADQGSWLTLLRIAPRGSGHPSWGPVTWACLSCREEWVLRCRMGCSCHQKPSRPRCGLTHKTGSRLSQAAVFQAPCSRPFQQCSSFSRGRKPQAEATQMVGSRAGLRADGPMCPAYPILSLSQPCWGPPPVVSRTSCQCAEVGGRP